MTDHRSSLVRTTLALSIALSLSLSLSGCAQYYYGRPAASATPVVVAPYADVLLLNQDAADALWEAGNLDPRSSVLVATLVNIDHLKKSSRMGRIFSEQIAGGLVQRGIAVTEVRLREHLALEPRQGQLLLSRELREVSQAHQAQAVVVGTYAVSARQVFVSLKLVSPQGNTIIAAHDYAVPLDEDVRALLDGY